MFAIGPIFTIVKSLFSGKLFSKNMGIILIVIGVAAAGGFLWWTIHSKNARIATLEKNQVSLETSIKSFQSANIELQKTNADLQQAQTYLNQQINTITLNDQQQQQMLQEQIVKLTSQKYKLNLLKDRNSTTATGQQQFLNSVDTNVNCILHQIAGIPDKC